MIKKLEWNYRDDEVVFCEPHGLKYSYYIYPQENCFELVLIEDDGQCDDNLTTIHTSIKSAQDKAYLHYYQIISYHIYF